MQNTLPVAAVDLGSNSFRLEIARLDHGRIRRTEYLKETVRQGSGLDLEHKLSREAMQRGWDCLARFSERLAGFQPGQVRAVATQTLREACNRDEFLVPAEKILGFPINVISGREEARLIYQGVAKLLPQSSQRRLVIDIGGRSTELVLGHGYEARVMESFRIGSAAWSLRYFADGVFSPRAFEKAEIAAKAMLDESASTFLHGQWDVALGSSGTVGAVSEVLAAAGWPPGIISREGLDWLLEKLVKAQSADKLKLEGIKEDRRAVIGGGLSVLRALFDLLGITQMEAAQGALRHGVLYELLDQDHDLKDLRATGVQRLAQSFGVDMVQAERVGQVAQHLFSMLVAGLPKADAEVCRRKLCWAAQLHEIGRQIAHSDYHKHGAYILENADVPGFTVHELQQLSVLVLGQRGKLRKLGSSLENRALVQQLLCVRLAVILCHARRAPDLAGLKLDMLETSQGSAQGFSLSLRPGWARTFPQSAYLLEEEVLAWQKTPWILTVAMP